MFNYLFMQITCFFFIYQRKKQIICIFTCANASNSIKKQLYQPDKGGYNCFPTINL